MVSPGRSRITHPVGFAAMMRFSIGQKILHLDGIAGLDSDECRAQFRHILTDAVRQMKTEGAQSANAFEYFFIFPSTAQVNDGIPASWNGEPFWPNASNPIGLGAYEGNCYVSDVAKVCVEPMKSGDHDK
tara:strand:+ start:317 stop:706 length:390 start_codon:yes stop_codon:yes gene_type:complete